MTARDGVTMQDVGLACLSPGFQTHDPIMREQLQRSLSVRDQQRSIIEARLQKPGKDDGPSSQSGFMGMPPRSSSKRRPPPGLSIVPPSASQFANERVIQSAPLHQTFTGRYQPQPLTRHVVNQSPTLGATSHMHQVPATQTNNRLPPLSDVFGSDALGRDREPSRQQGLYVNASSSNSSQSNLAPMPSPGLPAMSQTPSRPREYRSAEEAVQELSGGKGRIASPNCALWRAPTAHPTIPADHAYCPQDRSPDLGRACAKCPPCSDADRGYDCAPPPSQRI